MLFLVFIEIKVIVILVPGTICLIKPTGSAVVIVSLYISVMLTNSVLFYSDAVYPVNKRSTFSVGGRTPSSVARFCELQRCPLLVWLVLGYIALAPVDIAA